MERHDPLSTTPSVEQPATAKPVAPKKQRKLPPLLREVAEVKDDTLAFLYGGPEQQLGDYQRNLECGAKIREEFVQFCTANSYFSNWRQAWAGFMAQQPALTSLESIAEPRRITIQVKAPALPPWKARFIQAARA